MWFQNKQRKYFQHKLDGAEKMTWDNEFKMEKTLMIREEVRREYDGVRSKLQIIEEKVKTFPFSEQKKDITPDEKVKQDAEDYKKWTPEQQALYDEKVILTRDRDRYEAQMKKMDVDVYGSKKTNEYPDGIEGIVQTIESLRELKTMIIEYMKKI